MTEAEELHSSDENVLLTQGVMESTDIIALGSSLFHGSSPKSPPPFVWRERESGIGPWEPDVISLTELKRLAEKMLSRKSTLRMLILEEPDRLPRVTGLAKIEIFLRLLYKELEG